MQTRLSNRIFCLATFLLPAAAVAGWESVDTSRGAVSIRVPETPAPLAGRPLVVLLHGFGSNGTEQDFYFQLSLPAIGRGFLWAIPNGTENPDDDRFWNATDACCDLYGSGVDDVGFLTELLDAIEAQYSVDPHRVFFFGHSNGGFMAYRMACDRAERVTAIASLAGATFDDPEDCWPDRPVRVLQIHGTADDTVFYEGGSLLPGSPTYPGAEETVHTWAGYDGCLQTGVAGTPFDADFTLAGDETAVTTWSLGCRGPGAELWTIAGGGHVPFGLTGTFRTRVLDWFTAAGDAIHADGFESGDVRAWTPAEP